MELLSYPLNSNTPTYGDRNRVVLAKTSSISAGDAANDTYLSMTVHSGTHVDMPCHFYAEGQSWSDFNIDFWHFNNPLFVEIKPEGKLISTELIDVLDKFDHKRSADILIVKTGFCHNREDKEEIMTNYGFDPDVAVYIRNEMPKVRAFGFDSLSVSSFTNREIGRVAHKAFLNPENPIILLEDMDLRACSAGTKFDSLIIAPIFIDDCDAMPCTVFGFTGEK